MKDRKLAKLISVYGIGMILSKSIGVFAVLVYTRLFKPYVFGQIEMISALTAVLIPILGLGLDTAQSYYFMEAKSKGHREVGHVTGAVLQIRVGAGAILCLVLFILREQLNVLIFDDTFPDAFIPVVGLLVFFRVLATQHVNIFRLGYEAWKAVGLSFLETVSTVGLVIFFAFVIRASIGAYLVGKLVSLAAVTCVGIIVTANYRSSIIVNRNFAYELLRFGVPITSVSLLMQANIFCDRWFILNFIGQSELGIYAVGARFAGLMSIAISTVMSALNPRLMELLHEEQGASRVARYAGFYALLGGLAVCVLAFFSKPIFPWVVTDEYKNGWRVVGFLALASYLYGFTYFTWLGVFARQKTWLVNIALVLSLLLNIAFNALLIPVFGSAGAALASALSLLLSNIVMIPISGRYFTIQWPYLRITSSVLVAFGVCFAVCIEEAI